MTRLAYDYVELTDHRPLDISLPVTAAEFREMLGYDSQKLRTRDEFLAFAAKPWVEELREALLPLLDRERSILSVGSGKGEHEVPLFLQGFDITASDLDGAALEDAQRLFPGFAAMQLDALHPETTQRWDDVLVTGLDYALDDEQLALLLDSASGLLRSRGRVLLVHRFHDNTVTRLLDRALVPAWMATRRVRHALRNDGIRVLRREHGWRRTRAEVRALVTSAGYRVGRVRFALMGRELERGPVPRSAVRIASRADRRLHLFNSATIFELHSA